MDYGPAWMLHLLGASAWLVMLSESSPRLVFMTKSQRADPDSFNGEGRSRCMPGSMHPWTVLHT